MAKKEFSGGLNELFGENSTQREEQAQPTTDSTAQEVTPAEEATPEEEEDLISSVEDEELREALKRKRLQGNGRPRKGVYHQKASEGYERACMVVNAQKYEKIKAISLRETLSIKEVMEAAMDLAIEAYERKHGEILLNQKKGDASQLFK